MVACCCDIYTTDHSLELDQRVSFIVQVGRASLATSTEVGIVAYSTLVAVSNNIRRLVVAERSIAVDTIVSRLAKLSGTGIADWFINGYKAMAGVDETRIDNACRTIVPVWAIEALVTDTKDILVTAIADGMVARIAARLEKSLCKRIQGHVFNSRGKGMLWIVAMLKTHVTRNTEIKVITGSASDKAFLGKLLNA